MILKKIYRGAIAVLIIFMALGFAASRLSTHAIDTSLHGWYQGADGYAQALEEQKDNHKPIAVYFYTDWCESCKKLRENVLSSEEVKEYIREYIPVKVNLEAGPAEKSLGTLFGVNGFPAFYLLTAESKQPINILRSSNIKPLQFIDACEKVV